LNVAELWQHQPNDMASVEVNRNPHRRLVFAIPIKTVGDPRLAVEFKVGNEDRSSAFEAATSHCADFVSAH
jgi:hypothetical protein